MLRCRDVVEQVASDAGTRPLSRRLAVALHLLMCRHCRRYVRQLRQIGAAARRLYQNVSLDPPVAARVTAAVRRAAEEAGPPASPGPLPR